MTDHVDLTAVHGIESYEYWEDHEREAGVVSDPDVTVARLEAWERDGVPTPISGDMTARLRRSESEPPW